MIRGQQVMLDYDLAKIYGYEVKRRNDQVRRNISRFPDVIMFHLAENEIPVSLKSQFAIRNEHQKKTFFLFCPRKDKKMGKSFLMANEDSSCDPFRVHDEVFLLFSDNRLERMT